MDAETFDMILPDLMIEKGIYLSVQNPLAYQSLKLNPGNTSDIKS